MPYEIIERDAKDSPHEWVLVHAACSLDDDEDLLLKDTVAHLRDSYGETALLDDINRLCSDESIPLTFDRDLVVRAIRSSLPDPDQEGNKPPALTNYRAEPAELVARRSIQVAYGVSFPTAPQQGKHNANQPVLGFDGWGVLTSDSGNDELVLIQVKATDQDRSPPSTASDLAKECCRVPTEPAQIARTVLIMAQNLSGTDWQPKLIRMLELIGNGQLPPMRVAPVIVRGKVTANLTDLNPCRDAAKKFNPATALASTTQIGVDLAEFGRRVAVMARGVA